MTELLWSIDGAPEPIYIFGGGTGLVDPWSSTLIEGLVARSSVFWNEVPEMGAEAQGLAVKYGIDPSAPLATWVTHEQLHRVNSAAEAVGANPQMLTALRPWLAAQAISAAAEARAGLHREYSAEYHLTRIATQHGVITRSEFGTAEDVFVAFSQWPREVEVQRLMSIVADAERGPEWLRSQSEDWRAGSLLHADFIDETFRRDYLALYEHLVVGRNRAWLPRITEAIAGSVRSFFLMGTGHLVGAQGVLALLQQAGVGVRRVETKP